MEIPEYHTKDSVDEYLIKAIKTTESLSKEMMERINYIIPGGKRIRGMMFLDIIADKIESLDLDDHIKYNMYDSLKPFCIEVELIHAASLILDDLPIMDDTDERRGKLTLHKKYSPALAQLTALSLMSLAQTINAQTVIKFVDSEKLFDKQTPAELYRLYSDKSLTSWNIYGGNGLCVGQELDLNEKRINSFEDYRIMSRCKTGKLFELACGSSIAIFIAALRSYQRMSGEEETSYDEVDKFIKAGSIIGEVYQIADDIEDYEEDIVRSLSDQLNTISCDNVISSKNVLKFKSIEEIKIHVEELLSEASNILNGPRSKRYITKLRQKFENAVTRLKPIV